MLLSSVISPPGCYLKLRSPSFTTPPSRLNAVYFRVSCLCILGNEVLAMWSDSFLIVLALCIATASFAQVDQRWAQRSHPSSAPVIEAGTASTQTRRGVLPLMLAVVLSDGAIFSWTQRRWTASKRAAVAIWK